MKSVLSGFTICLLAKSLFFLPAASAQTWDDFGFGINYGISSNTFYTNGEEEIIDFRAGMGSLAGAFVTYRLNEVFTIQTEFNYTLRNATVSAVSDPPVLDPAAADLLRVTWRTEQIDVPLFFRVNLPYGEHLTPQILFGTALNFILDSDPGNQTTNDRVRMTESFDVSTFYGIGLNYHWPLPGRLAFELRYMLGTTVSHRYLDHDLKNAGLSLNVAYHIFR